MRSKLFILFSLILVFIIRAPVAQGDVFWDFSSGNLNGWTTAGSVSVLGGAAVLSDAGAENPNFLESFMYQGALVNPGSLYSLDFYFKPSLSNMLGDKGFFDTFVSSLYFTDNMVGFDPTLPGNEAFLLFEMDTTGPRAQAEDGTFFNITIPFDESTGWYHFNTTFQTLAFHYAVPMFELFDGNFTSDSTVLINNISITEVASVPEPGTLLLIGIGLVGLIGYKYKRRSLFARS